jgi:biopolymer transport protein ExbD
MLMRVNRRPQDKPEIYTGSMADISFLLIIFFMLTMVFSATKGLNFRQDEAPKEIEVIEPQEAIDVRVTNNGTLRVDGKPMALAELLPYIKPKLDANPDKPVILRTDAKASYGAMMIVFDELRSAPEKAKFDIPNIAIPTLAEAKVFYDPLAWLEQG